MSFLSRRWESGSFILKDQFAGSNLHQYNRNVIERNISLCGVKYILVSHNTVTSKKCMAQVKIHWLCYTVLWYT